jgi:hypothetical protein
LSSFIIDEKKEKYLYNLELETIEGSMLTDSAATEFLIGSVYL